MRIKTKDIPKVKEALLKDQNNRCALCRIKLDRVEPRDVCLDHCHVTGNIRGVLCRNCNGCEGKVFNLARRAKRQGTPLWWLKQLIEYMEKHQEDPSGVYHPTHKTEDEKRLLRNKKARERRAKQKGK